MKPRENSESSKSDNSQVASIQMAIHLLAFVAVFQVIRGILWVIYNDLIIRGPIPGLPQEPIVPPASVSGGAFYALTTVPFPFLPIFDVLAVLEILLLIPLVKGVKPVILYELILDIIFILSPLWLPWKYFFVWGATITTLSLGVMALSLLHLLGLRHWLRMCERS